MENDVHRFINFQRRNYCLLYQFPSLVISPYFTYSKAWNYPMFYRFSSSELFTGLLIS
jgi:hypothetical protein